MPTCGSTRFVKAFVVEVLAFRGNRPVVRFGPFSEVYARKFERGMKFDAENYYTVVRRARPDEQKGAEG